MKETGGGEEPSQASRELEQKASRAEVPTVTNSQTASKPPVMSLDLSHGYCLLQVIEASAVPVMLINIL